MKTARLVAGGMILLFALVLFGKGREERSTLRIPRRSTVVPIHEETASPAPVKVVPEETLGSEEVALDLQSSDPVRRADAVDALPTHRPDEAPMILEQILASDPDSMVRERAVLAYAERLGPKAVPVIKGLALMDPDENVASTARAALDSIRSEHPEPARGWLAVDAPKSFMAGETVTLRVRFGSRVDVSEVTLGLKLPKGLELVSPKSAAWKGSIRANGTEEVCFRVRVTADSLDAPIRASLKLDYPEELDVDVLRKEFRLAVKGGSGRITETR